MRFTIELPGLLSEIEAVAGRRAAVAIATTYGGRNMGFPQPESLDAHSHNYETNWLVQTVGKKTALAIVTELFPMGGRADIPSARTALRKQYVLDNAAALSVSEMAACLDIGERAVRRIKATLRDEGLLA